MHIVNFGLEWILFAILGWCVFKPPADKALIMTIYVVIMVFWLVGFGYTQASIGR